MVYYMNEISQRNADCYFGIISFYSDLTRMSSSPEPIPVQSPVQTQSGHGTSYFLNNLDSPVINLKLIFILLIKENNILEFIRICLTEFTLSLEVSYPLF